MNRDKAVAIKSLGIQDGGSKDSAKIFSNLLETSKNLPTTSSELGTILLSVNEIKKRARELRQKTKPKSDHTRAHYLLAGSGLAIQDVESSLNTLKSRQLIEQNVPNREAEGDLDTYLRTKKDENILSSIEQSLASAAKDFDNFVNQNFNLDWEQRKEEVRENFGIILKKRRGNETTVNSSFEASPPTWGRTGRGILDGDSRLNVNENFATRAKFEKYAKIINSFNNARQNGSNFSMEKEILESFNSSTEANDRQLPGAWKILDHARNSKDVIASSKSFLELQFLEYVENLYKKNSNEGLPTNVNKVKSFIDQKLKNSNNAWKYGNLTVVNGVPIWAFIFYLLRAGLTQDALEVAVANKLSFKKVEQSFLTYFKAYVNSKDRKLPNEYVSRLHTEYNQHIKNALDGDPFRLAVYKIIGRCDLTRKNVSSITLSIEDWIWIHIMLIKQDVSDDDPVYEKYDLTDFQTVVTSYGVSTFDGSYLHVLMLTGLYELAVQHAMSINEIDAVHLSIALANHKKLGISDYKSDNCSDLVTVSDGKMKLNLAKLLGNYTKSFKFSDPRIAMEYLTLINLGGTKEGAEVCHEALRELVLETKEFTILLGKVNRDGTRIPGVIEERQPLLSLSDEQDFLHKITEQAARRADEDGRVYDSLLLYQLADEYDIVIRIVNKLLSDLMSNTDLSQSLLNLDDNSETNPVLIAKKVINVYVNNLEIAQKINSKNKETCILLLKVVDIRKSYYSQNWQQTLEKVEEIDLIPFVDEASSRRKAQEFSSLSPEITKSIPNLLIITMTCVSKIVESLNHSEYQSLAKTQQVEALKRLAKNCMIYAGMIQYRMPRETYSILINLEVGL
ncbi:LANO_0B01904g1_1 [Lachancea nothofagi CBS 11611]|uniref:Nuclear pore protein n=1 Tax=Lachancea nothofagi CBS 11611 TaxID=1266666 RepID=A0A1G4IVM7_9SACH|nr:LANO_0B01904g1_1 [Lachancea nothofagi CBS 11611]